ncbi:hypothetical protein GCM10009844_12240 [Nocardioides koreensis]|uniref:DUF2785 domain-containing protein n=1 Tax=Nocardioides koreensis TaxID=433651 RepID=A0ABN2ZG76_9ACTN
MINWHRVREENFALPQGAAVNALLAELSEMLTSPDPEIRDDLAFTTLATWIDEGVVPDDRLEPLGDLMAQRLASEEVWTRSFAALVLCVIVATRGVCEPSWVGAFETWYPHESDLRGYDQKLGWLHAVAHGADLLGELGLRKEIEPRRMLELAGQRMSAETNLVWRDKEDARLAYAIGKVLTRSDLTREDAEVWLAPVAQMLSAGGVGATPAPATNTLNTLRTLYVLLSRGVRVSPTEVVAARWNEHLLDHLAEVLHPATPWMW